MLSMWTTKSEPNSFIYRNCNTSEQGAEKKIIFLLSIKIYNYGCCESSAKNFLFGVSTAKKFYRPETDNQIKADSKTVGIKV